MRRCARRARSRRGSVRALDSSSRAALVMTEAYHGSGEPRGSQLITTPAHPRVRPRGRWRPRDRYYRARYYHPELRRFVSEDLIGFLPHALTVVDWMAPRELWSASPA
jgi:hypothetical protein